MFSSGANVIMWSKCYHLVLSCDVIIWDDNTPFFLFFMKISLTPITLTLFRLQSELKKIHVRTIVGNPMPESTLILSQSQLPPLVRDLEFVLCSCRKDRHANSSAAKHQFWNAIIFYCYNNDNEFPIMLNILNEANSKWILILLRLFCSAVLCCCWSISPWLYHVLLLLLAVLLTPGWLGARRSPARQSQRRAETWTKEL